MNSNLNVLLGDCEQPTFFAIKASNKKTLKFIALKCLGLLLFMVSSTWTILQISYFAKEYFQENLLIKTTKDINDHNFDRTQEAMNAASSSHRQLTTTIENEITSKILKRLETGKLSQGNSLNNSTIKVGILHSLTGTMSISETSVVEAEKLAIKEINAAGGIGGRKIEAIIEDGESNWDVFKQKAEKLIVQDKVAIVFGCWTSASRKAVKPIFEEMNHILFYPVQYEGQECSKNIFYSGAAPNQQIEPAVDWLLDNKGKEFFLIGSDYVFPRTANEIIKAQLDAKGAKTVGEEYLPLGNTDVGDVIAQIKAILPNGGVIFNSLNGDTNVALFKKASEAGLTPEKYPIMSVSIAEEEVRQIGVEYLKGHYAAWNYFQTVESPENLKWVTDFKAEYGNQRVTNDPMEASYIMIYLWKQAVEMAGDPYDLEAVRWAMIGQDFEAPEGRVTLNANHHLSKTVRIGQIREDGMFDIIWATGGPIAPQAWNQYVESTKGYDCDWSDPAKGEKYKV